MSPALARKISGDPGGAESFFAAATVPHATMLHAGNAFPRGVSTANLLLAVTGSAERWLRDGTAELVDLERGDTIARQSELVRDVLFPESSVLGVISRVPDGRRLQTLSIGREGSSAAVSLIDDRSISDIVVQLSGRALRISTETFASEVAASPAFASGVRLHARRLFEQAQTEIACVNFHAIKGRVANWLLTNAERFDFEPLPVTPQMLADILGARRPTISDVLRELSRAECVESSRSSVRVVDAKALRAMCCACYRPTTAFRDEYVRLHSEMLGEIRRSGPAARLEVPRGEFTAAHDAYAGAVQALAERVDRLDDASAARVGHVAAGELATLEEYLKAYVRILRDSGQSPEKTLALIKSSIEARRFAPIAREHIGQLTLRWMIEQYYA